MNTELQNKFPNIDNRPSNNDQRIFSDDDEKEEIAKFEDFKEM